MVEKRLGCEQKALSGVLINWRDQPVLVRKLEIDRTGKKSFLVGQTWIRRAIRRLGAHN